MARFVGAQVSGTTMKEAEEILARVEPNLRYKVIGPAMRAPLNIIKSKAKEIAKRHDSATTGTREKQSKKLRDERDGKKHLWETIGTRVGVYSSAVAGVVGPEWPEGNIQNFYLSEKEHTLWGKSRHSPLPPFTFMEEAVDASFGSLNASFISAMKARELKLVSKS